MEPISMKPHLYVNDKELPAIKTWKAGETYEMIVKVKMTNRTETAGQGTHASLEVTDMMVPDENDQDISTMDNKEFGHYGAKMKRKAYEAQT